ncbi:MAG TPA: hypothetical protein DHV36_14515 [Desulfobacteraceae bacterium]|nr:hypothetical protein [Desulfobacteraceae bacterium]
MKDGILILWKPRTTYYIREETMEKSISIHRSLIVAICIITILAPLNRAAAEPVKVLTFQIPGLVISETEGGFVKLYLEAARRAGISVDLKVLPVKRARHLFESEKADSFFPALDASLNVDASKAVFHVKKLFAFVREGSPIPSAIEQLEGKKVCLTRGFTYPRKITMNENIKLDEASDPVQSFKKLAKNRCDSFVADPKVGANALEKSGEQGIKWAPDTPLAHMDVYFAFRTDEHGKDLAMKFTQALDDMKKDGTFGAIMSGKQK